MMKRFIFLSVLVAIAMTSFADNVTIQQAQQVAHSFLRNKTGEITVVSQIECAESFQLQNMYIFSNDHCFVIVSKEDAVRPILGYSLDGGFSLNAPSCVIDWLKTYDAAIDSVKEKGLRSTVEIKEDWDNLLQGRGLESKSRSYVEPLLQSTWDQGAPYNAFCPVEPEHSSGHTPAGCGATAMAQIMKYWGRPIRGIGSKTYIPRDHPQYGELTVDFSSTEYDWDNMPNSINANSPQVQIDAVATLIYHCGVSVEMDYGPGGSSVHKKIMDDAFRNYFNYNQELEYYSDTVFTNEQWINRMKENLDLMMPILYRGSNYDNNNGGHIFVCDGYDENNYFHFNWGWSGSHDGYFAIGNLHPTGDYSFHNYAIFDCAPNFSIDVCASPSGAGVIEGGGSYPYGSSVTIHASAVSGYRFSHWQDGNTDNPRTITVTNDATYMAYFDILPMFVVNTSVNPAGAGVVMGGGSYVEGSVITLTASANPGYTFSHWNDGSTANPRSVTVNDNLSFTAYFNHNQYVITVNANPSNAGTVSGGGAYYYGDHATLTATAYSGYDFVGWSDGSSENPHQVTVTGNATYTATFSQAGTTYYTVSTYVSPNDAGTVSGAGTYPAGASLTLTATANQGYTFDHWNDGSTQNPRTITVNNNMSFTAYFTSGQYTITVLANPTEGGTVSGGGNFAYGAHTFINAVANQGYEFLQWSDGSMLNPRYITVTGDATYTALFHVKGEDTFTITVVSADETMGQAYGGGIFSAGQQVQIAAMANSGYTFSHWNDSNTENPRTIIVNGNATYTAYFTQNPATTHTINLICNTSEGTLFGGGIYEHGATAIIGALPNEGYQFLKWSDNNTQNPRQITVTEDITLVALFTGTGLDENETPQIRIYPNPASETIRILGIEVNSTVEIFNIYGVCVKIVTIGENGEIDIRDLANGNYIVRQGKNKQHLMINR